MLKLKCKKHPRYTAKLSPKCSCLPCQELYELRLRAEQEGLVVVD